MATGLLALLDDIAALVKVSAATLDDVPTQVAKTTGKVSGIVIDDTAVTPKYVVGLDPSRELAIIWQITKKSLINKLIFLGPAALLLGFFAPQVIPYVLMVGGAYLCFEGYEKVHSMFGKHHTEENTPAEEMEVITPEELEKERVASAVRTDFILSAEIMAIAFATVSTAPLMNQIVVLLAVAIFITLAVYGFVGLIVKADDIGVHLAKKSRSAVMQRFGRSIVKFMPHFLTWLGYLGTAAMLWVGFEIILHGLPFMHHPVESFDQALGGIPFIGWLLRVLILALGGLALGFVVALVVGLGQKLIGKKK
jgi:predicted DNA repair protein MutK